MKRIYFILGGAAVVLVLAGVIVYCFVRETDPELEEHMENMKNAADKDECIEHMKNVANKDERMGIEHDLSIEHEKN